MFQTCRWVLCAIVVLTMGSMKLPGLRAQQSNPAAPGASATQPAANPDDVASPDAIIASLYDVISGPATKKRDWNRFVSLFLPSAQLIPTSPKPGGGEQARAMTASDYAAHAAPYFEKNGFFEKEVARKAERFGGIMQVFSTYESRHTSADATPFARGINSIQLFFDGSRWWIVTVFWQQETPSTPLPEEFLPHPHP